MAQIDGTQAAAQPDPETLSERIAQLVEDLVEPAKSTALEKLGEGKSAFDVASSWLRPKLAHGPKPTFAIAEEQNP
jgi:hypothetical protein